jgi:hypothetical protein
VLAEVRSGRDQPEALAIRAPLHRHGPSTVMRGPLVQAAHPFDVEAAGEVTLLVPSAQAGRARWRSIP